MKPDGQSGINDDPLARAERLRARAQEELLAGRPAAAVKSLALAIKLKPGIRHYHLLCSRACAALGRRKEAREHAALALGPGAGLYEKALVLGRAGKVVRMRRGLRRFAALKPPRGIQLLIASLETGRCAEAFRLAALLEKGGDGGAFFQLRDPFIDSRFSLPASYYREHIENLLRQRPPRGLRSWKFLWLAGLYWKLNQPEDSLKWLGKLEKLCGPADGWKLFLKGFLSLLSGEAPASAAEYFKRSLDSGRPDWQAACYLAEIDVCAGRGARGLRRFSSELKRAAEEGNAGTCTEILAWRGEMNLLRGSYAAAVRDLEAAQARGSVFAHCWLGGALLMQGKTNRALAMLRQARKLLPGDKEALVWYAEALRKAGRLAAARRLLLAAPSQPCVAANLVLLECAAGRPDQARKYFPALPGRSGGKAGEREMRAAAEKMLRLEKGNRRRCLHQSPLRAGLPQSCAPR